MIGICFVHRHHVFSLLISEIFFYLFFFQCFCSKLIKNYQVPLDNGNKVEIFRKSIKRSQATEKGTSQPPSKKPLWFGPPLLLGLKCIKNCFEINAIQSVTLGKISTNQPSTLYWSLNWCSTSRQRSVLNVSSYIGWIDKFCICQNL